MTDDAGRKALADEIETYSNKYRRGDDAWANALPTLSWQQLDLIVAALRTPLPATASREAIENLRKIELEKLDVIDNERDRIWQGGKISGISAALALAPVQSATREALDGETIQTLLDLLNPIHGALDYQIHINSEGEHVYDAPPDYEHSVTVLAQQERDLTQAVLILENRKRSTSTDKRGDSK